MIKRFSKIVTILLVVVLLSSSVFAIEKQDSCCSNLTEHNHSNVLVNVDHSLTMKRVTEALHGIENTTKDELTKRLDNVLPDAIVLT